MLTAVDEKIYNANSIAFIFNRICRIIEMELFHIFPVNSAKITIGYIHRTLLKLLLIEMSAYINLSTAFYII